MAKPVAGDENGLVFAAVLIHEKIVANAVASSGKVAKVKASEVALSNLHELNISAFRDKYQCDCHLNRQNGNVEVQADSAI